MMFSLVLGITTLLVLLAKRGQSVPFFNCLSSPFTIERILSMCLTSPLRHKSWGGCFKRSVSLPWPTNLEKICSMLFVTRYLVPALLRAVAIVSSTREDLFSVSVMLDHTNRLGPDCPAEGSKRFTTLTLQFTCIFTNAEVFLLSWTQIVKDQTESQVAYIFRSSIFWRKTTGNKIWMRSLFCHVKLPTWDLCAPAAKYRSFFYVFLFPNSNKTDRNK